MSKVKITIKTDNAAFEGDDYYIETARILEVMAANLREQAYELDCGYSVKDINGNTVAEFDHYSEQ